MPSSNLDEIQDSAVYWGEHVKLVGWNERACLRPECGEKLRARSRAGIDSLDDAGIRDRNVHESACRIEKSRIGGAGKWPLP